MEIEIHPVHCACRGGLWLTSDPSTKCWGPRGRLLPSTIRASHSEWSALGRPRTVEDYRRALERAVAEGGRAQDAELDELVETPDVIGKTGSPTLSLRSAAVAQRLMFLALANVIAAAELLEGDLPTGRHAEDWLRARRALKVAHDAMEKALASPENVQRAAS